MFSIAENYMKKYSTLNYLEDAFEQYEIAELERKTVDLGICVIREEIPLDPSAFSKKISFTIIE